jgi:hypothetical protein
VTGQRETTRYASVSMGFEGGRWQVRAHPWNEFVGFVYENRQSKMATAWTPRSAYAGLWPTRQAAAEVLVKQAGYELGEL